jgi:hypothetical protein
MFNILLYKSHKEVIKDNNIKQPIKQSLNKPINISNPNVQPIIKPDKQTNSTNSNNIPHKTIPDKLSINPLPINYTVLPLYCLMITGKDDNRYNFARTSILNFQLQDYPDKYLIIVNHGTTPLINTPVDHINEYMISKEDKTLGDLRNISLSYVPNNAIWTTWDDDDWRHTTYLSKLYTELITRKVKFIMIKNRISYNILTKFSWSESVLRGCCCTYFSYKSNNLLYDRLNTNEDGIIKTDIKKRQIPMFIINNNHDLYIRIVHANNTSRFVNKAKNSLNPGQRNLTYEQHKYLYNILEQYYAFLF